MTAWSTAPGPTLSDHHNAVESYTTNSRVGAEVHLPNSCISCFDACCCRIQPISKILVLHSVRSSVTAEAIPKSKGNCPHHGRTVPQSNPRRGKEPTVPEKAGQICTTPNNNVSCYGRAPKRCFNYDGNNLIHHQLVKIAKINIPTPDNSSRRYQNEI